MIYYDTLLRYILCLSILKLLIHEKLLSKIKNLFISGFHVGKSSYLRCILENRILLLILLLTCVLDSTYKCRPFYLSLSPLFFFWDSSFNYFSDCQIIQFLESHGRLWLYAYVNAGVYVNTGFYNARK